MKENEAHCFRCNKAVEVKDSRVITGQGKAKILKGVCPACGRKVSKFLKGEGERRL